MKAGLIVWIPFLLAVTGCATTKQVTDLETRVGALENKVTTVEQKQVAIESENSKIEEDSQAVSVGVSVHKPPADSLTKKDIQQALKNAGYYTGSIDGKFGKNTRKAIRAFQRANGLAVDGIAGMKTRELMVNYLTQ
ncbi:MAG: peptidoglycan-binding domain-containing protein [Candidatus Omnitrophica bacterium]|nr:peptidoglycan-binding domain-containing protein [Candidatus Omnitrophota bacterium]